MGAASQQLLQLLLLLGELRLLLLVDGQLLLVGVEELLLASRVEGLHLGHWARGTVGSIDGEFHKWTPQDRNGSRNHCKRAEVHRVRESVRDWARVGDGVRDTGERRTEVRRMTWAKA